jgi:glycosyltransferase involved in cell wall biosynthesis
MSTVSVIIPSYNHEKYIGECIQSILNQTYQDFEIVITDDGSTDRTVEIIESFDDPRIKFFKHSKNKGAPETINNCMQHANGKYIAPLGSDDAWYPEKLKRQVTYLDEHPDIAVVFSKVEWVNESGILIPGEQNPYKDVFNVQNRTRFEWLNHFFKYGNCLNMPSSLIHRKCFTEIGLQNPVLAALHDFDFWIRICLVYDIIVLDEKLVRYRWMSDSSNASGRSIRTTTRTRFESKQLLNHYLKIKDVRELLLVFPEAANYGTISQDTIPYFVARMALELPIEFMALWGLEVIYELLKDEKTALKLEKQCGFTYQDFIKLTGESNTFNLATIEQQAAMIAERDARIAAIYASRTWRLAKLIGMHGVQDGLILLIQKIKRSN